MTYCETCGCYDTRRCNGDVAWCGECGCTEGITHIEEEDEP